MSESKSTSISLDVYSSKYATCKAIFPHRIVRPLRKMSVNPLDQFSKFIDDIKENQVHIDHYIADNLKRATGKNCLCHSSNFPCEYCFAKGVKYCAPTNSKNNKKAFAIIRSKLREIKEDNMDEDTYAEIEKEITNTEKKLNKPKPRIVWPCSTRDQDPRTKEKVEEIVNRIQNGEQLTPDEAKGIVGPSPLLHLENFDYVRDSPTEYLHSVCLGVAKRLTELTFNVKSGTNRTRNTKRKLSSIIHFYNLMKYLLVPHEFSRRIRELDFAVMKGQEFRNLVLFFFPIVINCIEESAKERKVWLLFAFMIRSCVIPPKEFANIDLNDIDSASQQFYKLYQSLFGEINCTYNTHVVGCHLIEMRYHGPLTLTSAFSFESFYGEIRNSFVPGTQSTLKQAFERIFLKRSLTPHKCENSIYYSAKNTCLENNSMIYIFEDLSHKMYKICEVRDDFVVCYKQGRYKHTFEDLPTFDFSAVGVCKKGLLSEEQIVIPKEQIDGKVLEVDNLLITCPRNVLLEK